MNARRIFALAGFVLCTAACGGGAGPTLADAGTPTDEPGIMSPKVPPTDTTGFVPESVP